MTIHRNLKFRDSDAGLEMTGDMAESIASFRSAMRALGERAPERPALVEWLAPARRRRRAAQRRVLLAWGCAAALCFGAASVSVRPFQSLYSDPAQQAAHVAAAVESDEDTAFLEQVDNAIAEPVPASLAPLTEMDNWSSTTTDGSPYQTEKKNVTR